MTIIVPDEFEDELIAFQIEKKLNVGFTKNDLGVAFAKTLTYYEVENICTAIFISKHFVFALFCQEMQPDLFSFSVNTIHHELIHAHDDFLCNNRYEEIENCHSDGLLKKILTEHGVTMWKEYFACRLSSSTYNFERLKADLLNIIDMHAKLKEELSIIISEYRKHGDILIPVNELRIKTSTFLNYIAYFQGHLFAFGDYKKAKAILEIIKIPEDMIFEEIWIALFDEFNMLYDKYSYWDNASFNELGEIVLKYWNSFGVYPKSETDKEQVYWSISIV